MADADLNFVPEFVGEGLPELGDESSASSSPWEVAVAPWEEEDESSLSSFSSSSPPEGVRVEGVDVEAPDDEERDGLGVEDGVDGEMLEGESPSTITRTSISGRKLFKKICCRYGSYE
ncbi:MAG: hypothetical protein M1825_005952 [Sarcosagium campestre]|nr:MAG: hypothetical protein M1825_005952 [Sarcosagium campestre]